MKSVMIKSFLLIRENAFRIAVVSPMFMIIFCFSGLCEDYFKFALFGELFLDKFLRCRQFEIRRAKGIGIDQGGEIVIFGRMFLKQFIF